MRPGLTTKRSETHGPEPLVGALLASLAGVRGGLVVVPAMILWGFNVPRFLPPALAWLSIAVMVLPLLPWTGERAGQALAALERGWTRRPGAASVAAAVLVGGLLAALPDRVWFIGDFLQRVGAAEIGRFRWVFPQSLPLDEFVHATLPRALGLSPDQAAGVYPQVLGIVEGTAFALLAAVCAGGLAQPGSRVAAFATICFGGTLAVYTGYGRSAGEQALLTLAFGVTGLSLLRGRGGWVHALVLATALTMHRSLLVLLPAAGYAWGRHLVRAHGRRLRAAAPLVIPIAAALAVAPRLLGIVTGYDVKFHLGTGAVGAQQGPLLGAFSGLHLLDLINVAGILSPLALPVLGLAFVRRPAFPRGAEPRFLLILVASFVPLLLFVHPQQGLFRDWDVFAPAGVALSILTAWCLTRMLPDTPQGARLSAGVTLAAAVPVVALLVLSHELDWGLARVRAFVTEPPRRAGAERTRTLDFLGNRNYRLGRWDESADAFGREAETYPIPMVLESWAMAETERGNLRTARDIYGRAIARDSAETMAWLGYSAVSSQLGETDEARRALHELLRHRPGNAEALDALRQLDQAHGPAPAAPPPHAP